MKTWIFLALGLMSAACLAAGKDRVLVGGVTVTAQSLAAHMAAYVSAEQALKGGSIYVLDAQLQKVVALKPVKLDDGSHIHWLGGIDFLSWGEFKDAEGHAYFLDFYMQWKDGGLRFSGPITIYSRDKVKRYAWDESGEVMKRKPLDEIGIKNTK